MPFEGPHVDSGDPVSQLAERKAFMRQALDGNKQLQNRLSNLFPNGSLCTDTKGTARVVVVCVCVCVCVCVFCDVS